MNATAFVILLVLFTPLALAQSEKGMDMHDHTMMHKKRMQPDQAHEGKVHRTTGKVTKVDFVANTISIIHEPIPSMGWPVMNMEVHVKDKAMLDQVRPNAKVDFTFTQSGENYIITEIK